MTGGITTPDFKIYYREMVGKTARYWHQNRQVEQWNQTDDPNINSYTYGYLILLKKTEIQS